MRTVLYRVLSPRPRTGPPLFSKKKNEMQGACLNDVVIKLVESLVRLLPSASEDEKQEPAATPTAEAAGDTSAERSASTKSGYSSSSSESSLELRFGASSGAAKWLGREKGEGAREETHDSSKAGRSERRHEQRRRNSPKPEATGGGAPLGREGDSAEGKQSDRDRKLARPPPVTTHVEFWDKLR